MSKVYLLTDNDIEELLLMIDRNPKHGYHGGSSQVFTEVEERAQEEAHKFYNYQVRNWIDKIKK